MWVVEKLENARWIEIAQCTDERDADTIIAALQLANPNNEYRKRKQTGE